MRLGIIGLPQSGKTTLFNALTRATQPTGTTGKIEIHTAVVDVPDVDVPESVAKATEACLRCRVDDTRLVLTGICKNCLGKSKEKT